MFRIILTFFVFFLFSIPGVFALDTLSLDLRLQRNIEQVEEKLKDKTLYRKVFVYTNLKFYIENFMQENSVGEEKKYLLTGATKVLATRIEKIEKNIQISENFINHSTLSLSFNNSNISQVITQNKDSLASAKSVFIFRDSVNLTRKSIKSITSQIQEIHRNILIFIDQEGGQINRYQDFDIEYTKENLLENNFIQLRKNKLTDQEYNLFLSLFPVGKNYFPSLYQIGSLYDNFSEESAVIVLEMFAYFRLQSHADLGINTYGLVTDLSRGNPSITPLGRSFSKHSNKYKLLLNAFAVASRETGVLVYLKHFPGVGLGAIDSHNGVLDLRNYMQELQENIELFAYAREAFSEFPIGVMLGHTILPNTLKQRFTEIAESFDFMITDDLAMQGYSQATGKTFQNGFFSIDELEDSENLMILDRKSSFYIK